MFRTLARRLVTLARHNRVDDEIQREIASHVDMERARRERAGMAPDEARRTTLADFGGVLRTREEVRDSRGLTFWHQLLQDARFGLRTLRRSPGYTLATVLILGLGIGANTAIFSVIDGVLLKPLPFRDSGNLVLIQQSAPASNVQNAGVSIPELFDYRARLASIRDLVEYHGMSFTLLDRGEPDQVNTGVVSSNFFGMLGVQPMLGRSFVPGDDVLGANAVLILSYGYWQSKFGGDPSVIGRVVSMNDRPHTIVGVLPDFPQYPRVNDVYMPTSACPFRAQAQAGMPGNGFRAFAGLRVFGRLAPGATPASATSEVAAIAASFPRDHPSDYRRAQGLTGQARSLEGELVKDARPMLFALGGAALLVLLIACANVANLSLARTIRRERELAVRTALGAGRGRLFRQLITESVLVSIAGGALGLGLAWLSLDLLVSFVGRFTTRTAQIGIDGTVLWFALALAVVTGLVFGSAPALASRRRLSQSMREGGANAGESGKRQRLRATLVVAQVAVSFALVVGAALLLESFHRLAAVPLGFDTRQVMSANISANFSKFNTNADSLRIHNSIIDRLRSSPGVRSAAVTSAVPLSNIRPGQLQIVIEGHAEDRRSFQVDPTIAGDGYFETLGIPLLAGRTFRPSDDDKAPEIAVINQSAAKYWNGANPIGSRIKPDVPPTPGQPDPGWITVVGVVADYHLYKPDVPVDAQVYIPFKQNPSGGGALLVRADGDPAALVSTIKAAVHGIDDQIPVVQIQTLETLKNAQLASPGLTAALLSIFAGVALLITLAGLAGVIGTSVSQRTREFGLRMALGASPGSVLRLVMGQGVLLVIAGLGLGVGGAYFFSRAIRQYLFATPPTDTLAYAAVAALFVAAAAVACAAPARRATAIDPLTALRAE